MTEVHPQTSAGLGPPNVTAVRTMEAMGSSGHGWVGSSSSKPPVERGLLGRTTKQLTVGFHHFQPRVRVARIPVTFCMGHLPDPLDPGIVSRILLGCFMSISVRPPANYRIADVKKNQTCFKKQV